MMMMMGGNRENPRVKCPPRVSRWRIDSIAEAPNRCSSIAVSSNDIDSEKEIRTTSRPDKERRRRRGSVRKRKRGSGTCRARSSRRWRSRRVQSRGKAHKRQFRTRRRLNVAGTTDHELRIESTRSGPPKCGGGDRRNRRGGAAERRVRRSVFSKIAKTRVNPIKSKTEE